MGRGPRDPPEQGPPKETENPVETERTNATAAEVNPPVPLPELPTWQSFELTSARMAREEARAKYITKKKIKRLERQRIVSIDGNKHTLRCGATVGSAYFNNNICGCPETVTDLPLVSEGSGAGRHACSPPQ